MLTCAPVYSKYILGNKVEDKHRVILVLLGWLGHPGKNVREAAISSLDKLDSNWLQTQHAAHAISTIIKNFDSQEKANSKAVLLELGDRIVPFLNQGLVEGQKKIVLESIIEILGELGSKANASLPALLKLKNEISNHQTLSAINNLIEKLHSDNMKVEVNNNCCIQ